MKRKRFVAFVMALLVTLNLTACTDYEYNKDIDEEKKQEETVDENYDILAFILKALFSTPQEDVPEEKQDFISLEEFENKFNELKDQIKEELKLELAEEIKDEIIAEIRKEVADIVTEVTPEVTPEVSEPVVDEGILVNRYAYLSADSLLYSEAEKVNELCLVDKFQSVYRVKDYQNGLSLVEYQVGDTLYTGYVSSENLVDLPNLFVEVDISSQSVKLIQDQVVIYENSIVSGKPSSPTREGYFNIDSRETNRYLTGPGYRCYVNYWMPFDGDIGLHDADGWRNSSEYGNDTYLTSGSHGCVNMPNEAAKVIYENVKTGDMVLVHK